MLKRWDGKVERIWVFEDVIKLLIKPKPILTSGLLVSRENTFSLRTYILYSLQISRTQHSLLFSAKGNLIYMHFKLLLA